MERDNMPYLTFENKNKVEELIEETNRSFQDIGSSLKNSGELNYVITKLIQGYFKTNGGRYQQINDIVGALESAKAEFQRRIVGPYEDTKIRENGDVY